MPARRMARGTAVGLIALVAIALVAPTALAKQYPPNNPTVGVSDGTVTPGQHVVVSGNRWKPGTIVHLSFHSAPVALGTATVGGDGSFATEVVIPATATPGRHDIVVRGRSRSGSARTVRTSVLVLGDTVTASGSTAFTGSSGVQVWMILAGVLAAIGATLIVLTRRRSRGTAG
jgi:hypothetical protein